ncbi:MAG: hypothetical protein A4E63_00971 [Syntrophorhabdus sp. PtaU1.Bin050]|nr:MAG: hypothetical protein A4E63_00971 [Syntrophorhabdus sp. PtaU1.Bin050]
MKTRLVLLIMALVAGFCALPAISYAHCDTLEGPVVTAAKVALEKKDVTPVLKWLKKDDEAEVRELFRKTLIVRGKGPESKELADRYFFETLVRLHRAGEGAPFTGLQSGPPEPIIAEADKALEKGSIDGLVKEITDAVTTGIRKRFTETFERKKHADESVDTGREFVEAYVGFTHYVERLHEDALSSAAHHGEEPKSEQAHTH